MLLVQHSFPTIRVHLDDKIFKLSITAMIISLERPHGVQHRNTFLLHRSCAWQRLQPDSQESESAVNVNKIISDMLAMFDVV